MSATQISISDAIVADPGKTLKGILISDDKPEAIVLFTDETFCCLFALKRSEGNDLQIVENSGGFNAIDFGTRALVNAGMWTEEEMAAAVAAAGVQIKADIELQERRLLAYLQKKYPPPGGGK